MADQKGIRGEVARLLESARRTADLATEFAGDWGEHFSADELEAISLMSHELEGLARRIRHGLPGEAK